VPDGQFVAKILEQPSTAASLYEFLQAFLKFSFIKNAGRKEGHRCPAQVFGFKAAPLKAAFLADAIENLAQKLQIVGICDTGCRMERTLQGSTSVLGRERDGHSQPTAPLAYAVDS